MELVKSEPSTPVIKRKREEEPEDLNVLRDPVSRSVSFWFNDGSIILQVNAPEKAQLRVHSSILCARSPSFSDTVALAGPERVEGCPIVGVDGSKQDWEHFLTFVYKNPARLKFEHSDLAFEFLASTLRLAARYKFVEIRQEVFEIFTLNFPRKEFGEHFAWLGAWKPERLIAFTNLAVELKIQSMLPMLYCMCVAYFPVTTIFAGLTSPTGEKYKFSPATQCTILVGKERLRAAGPRRLLGWLMDAQSVHSNCSSGPFASICPGRKDALEICAVMCAEPQQIWLDNFSPEWLSKFCSQCRKVASKTYADGKVQQWNSIPSFFDLPGWGQLKDFED